MPWNAFLNRKERRSNPQRVQFEEMKHVSSVEMNSSRAQLLSSRRAGDIPLHHQYQHHPHIKVQTSTTQKAALVKRGATLVFLTLVLGACLYYSRSHREIQFESEDNRFHESHTQEDGMIMTSTPVTCSVEEHAEYYAPTAVNDGKEIKTRTHKDCQNECLKNHACEIWVWCGDEHGCNDGSMFGECWLKADPKLDVLKPDGRRGVDVPWMSGTCVTEGRRIKAEELAKRMAETEEERLARLHGNMSLPLVYFDVNIKDEHIGKIQMVLYPDISPRSAENFRQLVTGEAGVVPEGRDNAGTPYHLKGAPFYRIIHNFIDQSGIYTDSVFGGQFKDDKGGLELKHSKKGLLSMANMGPDTNTAHFSIMMGPAHHLDGHYTIFGQVVTGFDVVDAVNDLSIGKPENTATADAGAVIADCGQIRKGTIVPDLDGP